MTTAKGRTQKCARAEARTRLAHARKFLEAAQLAADEDAPESSSVAAALAVLCGIAAASVEPGGKEAANALRRLIDLKDTAH